MKQILLAIAILCISLFIFSKAFGYENILYIQPDRSENLYESGVNTNQAEGYYYENTGTYNQVFWFKENKGLDKTIGILFDIYNGISTTTYTSTLGQVSNYYGGEQVGQQVVSCINALVGGATSTITLTNTDVIRIGSNTYSHTTYGDTYGNRPSGELAWGFSYSNNCETINTEASTTHIISITPADMTQYNLTEGSSTQPIHLETDYYIAPSDLNWYKGVVVWIRNVDQGYGPVGTSWLSEYSTTTIQLGTSGYNHWEKDVNLPEGNYEIVVKLISADVLTALSTMHQIAEIYDDTLNTALASTDDTNPIFQYHQYRIGNGTLIGNLRQDWNRRYQAILNSTSTASSTASATNCSPFSGNFDFDQCLAYTFIPSQPELKRITNNFIMGVGSVFPLGYFTNFYGILINTTTTPFIGIHAKLPSALGLGNEEINLDIDANTLDFLWNATTSQFYGDNPNTDSDQTLLQIVGGYWNIFVYIAAGLYILSRIVGSHLIGEWFKDEQWNVAGGKFRPHTSNASSSDTTATSWIVGDPKSLKTYRRKSHTISKRKNL